MKKQILACAALSLFAICTIAVSSAEARVYCESDGKGGKVCINVR